MALRIDIRFTNWGNIIIPYKKRSYLMKRLWFIFFLFFSSTLGQNIDTQWNSKALQRLMHEWDVKLEKMELHLQASMRRTGIDMWIIMSREFNVDPMLQMFGDYGISGWYGHRNAYIFFDPGNNLPLERTLLGTHQSGRMREFFPTIISYGQEGLKPHLADFIKDRNPKKIAINRSRTVSMADGITVNACFLRGCNWAGLFITIDFIPGSYF